MFGPIKETSLDMLPERKRNKISETLIRTAVTNWDKSSEKFSFELRGETCEAEMRDTWNDGHELSIRIKIGEFDLYASGFYYAKDDRITHVRASWKARIGREILIKNDTFDSHRRPHKILAGRFKPIHHLTPSPSFPTGILSGTGSSPLVPNGLHFATLKNVIQVPPINPCLAIASKPNSEQVGWWRQELPRKLDRVNW